MTVLAIVAVMGITGYLFATVLESPYLVSICSILGVALLAGGAYAVIAGSLRENKKEREDIWGGAFYLLLIGLILVTLHVIDVLITIIQEVQITKSVLLTLGAVIIVGDIIHTTIKEKHKKSEDDIHELVKDAFDKSTKDVTD